MTQAMSMQSNTSALAADAAGGSAAPLLRVTGLASGYKSSIVLNDISFDIGAGEAVAMLGKNGMGKSTLLKTLMGYLPKQRGSVTLQGRDATRLPPYEVARAGVAYAAQEQPLFQDLSIRDNLRLGLASDALFDERFADTATLFPVFQTRLRQPAGTLSGGEQKMLLVARALMMRPKLLLLDEITEGLQPSVIERLADALLWERRHRGTTMLIVEQNVSFALKVADRYLMLKQGSIVDQGPVGAPDAAARIFDHLKV